MHRFAQIIKLWSTYQPWPPGPGHNSSLASVEVMTDGLESGPASNKGGNTMAIRTRAQRRRDTEARLNTDVDLWVASASADGIPYLVPLSFDWDGKTLLLATPAASPTGRNLATSQTVRLGLGSTRDVSMLEGTVEILAMDALPADLGDRFAARTGFDPRTLKTPYRWFRVTPVRIDAWREADELDGRELMCEGRWLD